jgi:DNA-binding NtrC family response regulator
VILGSEDAVWAELVGEKDAAPDDVIFDGSVPLRKLTRRAARDFEHKIILKALQNHKWNRKEAARSLRISYRALLYKLREAADIAAARRAAEQRGQQIASD